MPHYHDSPSATLLRVSRHNCGGPATDLSIDALNDESEEPPNQNGSLSSTKVSQKIQPIDTSTEVTDVSSDSENCDSDSPSPRSEHSTPGPNVQTLTDQAIKYLDLSHVPKPETENASEDESDYDPSMPSSKLPPAGVAVSWVNPKLEARVTKTGSGIFALEPLDKGETLIVWTGRVVDSEHALKIMNTHDKHYLLQIGMGFYQTPLQALREPADWSNHSCNPNAGFGKNSPICLSSMRPVEQGEEITFDYGMCETDPRLWEPMDCACGNADCRASITANDWKLPHLWDKYDGYFAPHVQKLVNELRAKTLAAKETAEESFEAPSCWDRVLARFGLMRIPTKKQV